MNTPPASEQPTIRVRSTERAGEQNTTAPSRILRALLAFVAALAGVVSVCTYQNVLERQPDPSGLAFWIGKLENGMERGEVILLISNDTEFINKRPPPSDDATDTGPLG